MSKVMALLRVALLATIASPAMAGTASFDHEHGAWTAILAEHQRWSPDGLRSSFDYAGARSARDELQAYLASLAAVEEADFAAWSPTERLAFLINLYNAATVERLLDATELPPSIRDLGSLFRPVWKQRFIALFGETVSLDHVEHDLIRGNFEQPLIHAGLVCASCSCPPLRSEAYAASTLEEQLSDTMRRFLADRGRNRFEAADGTLRVSRIFDWFAEDFEDEDGDIRPFFAAFADALADDEPGAAVLRDGTYRLRYLTYDWSLNTPGNCPP